MFKLLTGISVNKNLSPEEKIFKAVLKECLKGLGFTSPNPSVGAVLVNDKGEIIAKGYHKKSGKPHAEIELLSQLGKIERINNHWELSPSIAKAVKGHTLYVSLEPCAHEGKTPSCAKTLAQLPLKKVVALIKDPNPQVAGKGFKILENAGIVTECIETTKGNHNIWVQGAYQIHEFFLHFISTQSPFITLKAGISLDGQLGFSEGHTQSVTSSFSREKARFLRSLHDGILVGKNTVLKDNPLLNLRNTPREGKDFKLFVLDSTLELLKKSSLKIYKTFSASQITLIGNTLFFNKKSPGVYLARDLIPGLTQNLNSVNVWLLPSEDKGEYLKKLLFQNTVQSLWVEGGAKTFEYFLKNNLAHRLWLFQSPIILGGGQKMTWSGNFTSPHRKGGVILQNIKTYKIGPERVITGTFPK